MNIKKSFSVVVLCMLLIGCRAEAASGTQPEAEVHAGGVRTENGQAGMASTLQPEAAPRETGYSVWSTYWDTSTTAAELGQLESKVKNLCYFEVYYDETLNFVYPAELEQQLGSQKEFLSERGVTPYVTFVNDLKRQGQSSSLKDVELLHKLLDTDTARAKQAQSMVRFAKEHGFRGIEIDYEKIRDDRELWQSFGDFLTLLSRETEKEGLKLRVLLEPQTPSDLSLPQEPTYVMMCYNLFGSGTEPGPKANREFLLEMAELMQGLAGKRDFALATGGYDFTAGGSAEQVTEQQAEVLKREYGAAVVRDTESSANWFTYQEANGIRHTVWYADGKTLAYWIQVLNGGGETEISLWRLGGNVTIGELIK